MFRVAALTILPLLLVNAQTPAPPSAATPAPVRSDPLGRSTPYGTVVGFLKAAAQKDYARASSYLDLRGARTPANDLTRQLDEVLNRYLSADLNKLSRSPEGDPGDGLAAGREQVGFIQTPSGKVSVELARVGNNPPVWVFSAETLRNIPRLASGMPAPGFTRYLPQYLVENRFLNVPLWRWIAGILEIVAAWAFTSIVTRILIYFLRPLMRRLTGEAQEMRAARLRGPIRLLLFAGALRAFAALSVSLLARQIWIDAATVLAVAGMAWLVAQFGDITANLVGSRLERRHQSGKIAVLNLGRHLFKIFVVIVAIILLLTYSGVNVTAMLAGLGVGGVALALAAQKTLENLFGGIGLIMRDIVRPGDLCTMAGETGTVEDVGLGATQLRTLDRTVVSVPNAELSQKNLENISRRDKFWFHQVFGLRYDTSPKQMREILTAIEGILSHDSRVEGPGSRVRFIGFGESSLTLEIFAYILEQDYVVFLTVQQTLLLAILEAISAAGATIASPAVVTDLNAVAGKQTIDRNTAPKRPKDLEASAR